MCSNILFYFTKIVSLPEEGVFMLGNEHSADRQQLNIAAFSASTQALGPGKRAVIWVQGCPLNCPGCIAPGWIPFTPATLITPEELLGKIDLSTLDGLTLSGGEPMEQAAGLAKLVQLARQTKELNIITFTGYRFERLVNQPPNAGVRDLLAVTDVLIDGPYVQSKNNSIGLRGSSNQRIIHLTPKLKKFDLESQSRRVEVSISNGEFAFVGIPTPGMKSALELTRQWEWKG